MSADLSNRKTMDLKEFVGDGFLREVNRQFFHPLGLALYVEQNANGEVRWGGILDGRDDEEGFVLGNGEELERSKRFQQIWEERTRVRMERLGFVIQPLEG